VPAAADLRILVATLAAAALGPPLAHAQEAPAGGASADELYAQHPAGRADLPVNLMYSKVTKIGNQMVSFAAGARYYLESPPGGPDWGLRFVVTLLYPK
jgi:hypothetical protein